MKVDKVLLLAGSPSMTYTIAGIPKTFTGVVNLIIRSGDVDYNKIITTINDDKRFIIMKRR